MCHPWQATVVVTFALGTAAGDLTAYTFGLGYLASGLMFLAVIAIPAAGYGLLRMNAVFMFWFAYILTRPVGASFADWLGFPRSVGGVGVGHGRVSLITTLMIVVCVVVMSATSRGRSGGHGMPPREGVRGSYEMT